MEQCFSQMAFIGPGGPELLVVMLVLLLMFGAKDAPRILRKLNEWFNQIRNTADGFKREVMYSDWTSDVVSHEAEEPGKDEECDEECDEDNHESEPEATNTASDEDTDARKA